MPVRIDAKIEAKPQLRQIRTGLRRAQKQFLERTAAGGRRAVARKAPGGPRGRIGMAVRGDVISDHELEISVTHPGARALNYGAYITPKGLSKLTYQELVRQPRRLKFEVGGRTVFAPLVRYKGTHYFERGLSGIQKIVDEEWRRAFNRVPDLSGGPPTAVGRILPRD